MKDNVYIGIDAGGTWLKGVAYHSPSSVNMADIAGRVMQTDVQRVPSRLHTNSKVEDFIKSLDELFALLLPGDETVAGIGISTAGIVDYAGKNLLVAASHLGAVKSPVWKEYLENKYAAPVILINDADAAALGAAAGGYLHGSGTIGVMPVGTGVGFSIWRNGRKWQPGKILPLIGSVSTPCGSFDAIGGVSEIARKADHDLCKLFSDQRFIKDKERYISGLADIIYSACVLYRTGLILIGGGLASAVTVCDYPLGEELTAHIAAPLASLQFHAKVKVMPEGNLLPLTGAVSVAVGESAAKKKIQRKNYAQINTEIPYDPDIKLHSMDSRSIVELLWQAEQEAGEMLQKSLDTISDVARTVARKLSGGGKLIYVGAGTSGRLAAMDNVELGCTFGFPREKVLTLIAGGIADASVEIEDNFEEDASAVPEMLLVPVSEKDIVIGISVSGSAYYVLSALAVAQEFGARTVFIRESPSDDAPFADMNISLHSGHELVAGSTRMKAGTATKKVLNFISTAAMILLGNVHGPYMTGVACINEKLICRAQTILNRLFGMNGQEAEKHLAANGYSLRETIRKITETGG